MYAVLIHGKGFACWHPNVAPHGTVIGWKKKKDAAFYIRTNDIVDASVVDISKIDVPVKLA